MKMKIRIKGMRCQHCVASVSKALNDLTGVTKVEVDLDSNSAEIEAEQEIPAAEISAAISAIGFEVEG